MQPPVDESLAAFAAAVDVRSVPVSLADRARLTLLDTVAVILAAVRLPEASGIIAHAAASGGAPEATAFGLADRVSVRSAAFANGWLADLLDLEDTFKFGGNHPAATVIPATIAMAERQRAPGTDIVAAIIAGYEVENRIARALYPTHELRGHLTTGTAGAIGAAAAAGRILGLDAEQMAQALRIAGFLCPISASDTLWEGFSAKPGHAAQACAVGVDAALLAQRGFLAAGLEGATVRRAGFLTVATDQIDRDALLAGLGEEYTLPSCTIKLYPCCGYTHGAIDAAIELRGRLGDVADEIRSVTVRSYDIMVKTGLGLRHTTTDSSFTECQFSLPYVVAVGLIDGRAGIEQFTSERRADPRVHRLASKVTLIEDPEFTANFPKQYAFAVEVDLDGHTETASVTSPRGTPQRPITPEDVRAKFDELVGPVLGDRATGELADTLLSIDSMPEVTWPNASAPVVA